MSKRNHKSETAPPTTTAPVWAADVDATAERWLHGGIMRDEATQVRAHQLWERAGHPQGDGVSFWLAAEAELSADG